MKPVKDLTPDRCGMCMRIRQSLKFYFGRDGFCFNAFSFWGDGNSCRKPLFAFDTGIMLRQIDMKLGANQ